MFAQHEKERAIPEILILGLGNILMSDDGVGVRVVERLLERYEFSGNVQLVDGGTRGLALVPSLEGVKKLIVIDAVASGKQPGDLTRLTGDELIGNRNFSLFSHQDGLAELLLAAELSGLRLQEVVLLGVDPAVIEPGLSLSPLVAARVCDLTEQALEQLRGWGEAVHPKVIHHSTASIPMI